MKRAIIINVVLASVLALTGWSSDINSKEVKNDFDSVNQKIKEIKEIKDKSIKSKLQEDEFQEKRELPKNHVDALRIILKEDGEHIQEVYEYNREHSQDEPRLVDMHSYLIS